jgi:hypothetical protein
MGTDRTTDTRDRLDCLIDEALASYSAEVPRWGLERRVLRFVRSGDAAGTFGFPRWAWAVPAVLAGFVMGVMMGPSVRSAFSAALNPSIVGEWCARLQATWLSVSIRQSILFYPYLNGVHLLGLAVMLGPSMMLDLRLIGALWKNDPVSKIESRFLPIVLAGFFLVIGTGMLLFISTPVKAYESVYFRIKIGLILLAMLNALVFHSTIDRRRAEWDMTLPPPAAARCAGILGLMLWTGVIIAGRYMAYNF